mmetsp:Transcript_9142/g.13658  ORF Transcript_9142/g.13658 Transcript_9142/m.13658 type:complete len:150 (-) Transcript_9142:412-861(-)
MATVDQRKNIDNLFLADASLSMAFGLLSLLAPHGLVTYVSELGYSHGAHEALRLYGCLRIAVAWILFNVRLVDDGRFRRSICEALGFCYVLQALVVLRAQFTDQHTVLNWFAILALSTLSFSYMFFRFGKGGDLIKIYELPTASARGIR